MFVALVPAAPAPILPVGVATRERLRLVDAELARLEDRYEAIGDQLLAMDEHKKHLAAERKFLAASLRAFARKGGRRCANSR